MKPPDLLPLAPTIVMVASALVLLAVIFYWQAYLTAKMFAATLKRALEANKAEVGLDLLSRLKTTHYDTMVLRMIPAELITRTRREAVESSLTKPNAEGSAAPERAAGPGLNKPVPSQD